MIQSSMKPLNLWEVPKKIDYKTLHLLLIEGIQKYDMISEIYTEFFTNMFDFIKDVINEGINQSVIRSDINPTIVSEVIENYDKWEQS